MDPNLFYIDWERLFQVLAVVIVLAFIIERSLAVLFENKYVALFFSKVHLKELVALLVAYFTVSLFEFDAVSIVMVGDENTTLGYILTAGVIAGGSKASIKLFVDIWKVGNKIQNEQPPQVPAESQTN